MKTYELKLFLESEDAPLKRDLLRVIEKNQPGVKVVAIAESIQCPICNRPAEIVQHWRTDRRKWWQFWKLMQIEPDYHFSSGHPCYKEASAFSTTAGVLVCTKRTGNMESPVQMPEWNTDSLGNVSVDVDVAGAVGQIINARYYKTLIDALIRKASSVGYVLRQGVTDDLTHKDFVALSKEITCIDLREKYPIIKPKELEDMVNQRVLDGWAVKYATEIIDSLRELGYVFLIDGECGSQVVLGESNGV